jgi:hypothetical protein
MFVMRRVTVTIPDDLEDGVEDFVRAQDVPPAITAIMQSALRQFLTDRGFLPARRPLHIRPAPRGSGRRDVSQSHDRYIAEK